MTQLNTTQHHFLSTFTASAGHIVHQLTAKVKFYYSRSQQRYELRNMPDHLLRDIGISRAEAEYEGTKPFWKD